MRQGLCVSLALQFCADLWALMVVPLTLQTSDELPATTRKLFGHIPLLAWNVRVQSGDLLFRGARRRRGARVRRVRGIRQLFGVSHMA